MRLTLAEPTPAERTIDPRRPTAEGRLVPAETLRALSRRSDRRGAVQTALHFGALGDYLIRLSGCHYWLDRASAAWDAARADFSRMPYVPAGERGRVTASVRAMLALYGAIAAASIAPGSAAALTYWVLPGLLGYPA